jgi:hypothetical protein
MNSSKIKGNIFAILTMFLLVFVSCIIGNKFTENKLESVVIMGYALISLGFGAFIGMCFMIRETFQDINKLADESLYAWDALQDEKMQNIHNIKNVHEENIKFYESKIAEYKKRAEGHIGNETAYLIGHVDILEMLIKESKYKLEQLLLS